MTIHHSTLNVKALVGTFKQEKALVEAFYAIVKLQTSRKFVSSSSRRAAQHREGSGAAGGATQCWLVGVGSTVSTL